MDRFDHACKLGSGPVCALFEGAATDMLRHSTVLLVIVA